VFYPSFRVEGEGYLELAYMIMMARNEE